MFLILKKLWSMRRVAESRPFSHCRIQCVEHDQNAAHLVRLFPKDDARLASGVADIRMNAVYRQFEAARPIDKPGYKAPKTYPCERCGEK